MMGAEPVVVRGSEMDINAEDTWAVNRAWTLWFATTCEATKTLETIKQTHEILTEEEARQVQYMHSKDARWGDEPQGQQEDNARSESTAQQKQDENNTRNTH